MFIRKLVLSGLFSVAMMTTLASPLIAQERVDLRDNATAIIRQLAPIDFSKIKTSVSGKADPKLDLFAKALGLSPRTGDSLGLMQKSSIPKTDLTSYRFQQNYQGIPIWGESIVLTQHADKKTRHLGGFAIKETKLRVKGKPKISSRKAMQIAKDNTTKKRVTFEDETSRKVIFLDTESGKSFMAWEVSFFVMIGNKPSRPVYIIDTNSGETLKHYDNLQHLSGSGPGGNKKTGCYTYGKGKTPPLEFTKKPNGKCSLVSRNVTTRDCQHSKNKVKCTVPEFECNYNKRRKFNNACSPLNDAHFFGNLIYEMYFAWYHTKPLKKKLVMNVHFGSKMDNAFWNGKEMFFGDGANVFYPLVSLDVAAHEISHGFTTQHSGLIYSNQSGGINEAFSDMAAEVAEAYFDFKYNQKITVPTSQKKPEPEPRSDKKVETAEKDTSQGDNSSGINSIISGGGSGYGDQDQSAYGSGNGLSGGGQSEGGINSIISGGDNTGSLYGSADNSTQTQGLRKSEPDSENLESGESTEPAYDGRTMFKRPMPDYKIGADVFVKKGQALRYLDNPAKDGKSINHASKYKKGMDVHHSSGVFNRAFYLLSQKKNWGIRKAFEVFLTANAYYWTKNETFKTAARKVVDAASDYSYNTSDVVEVFQEVGVL